MSDQETIRVLAVSHTGLLGGAERSLLELLARDQSNRAIDAAIATPPGELASAADALGITVFEIGEFEFGFDAPKSALPVAAAKLGRASIAVHRSARAFEADVIHANSPRAAMISGLASGLGRVPMVTHIRDELPTSRRADIVRRCVSALSKRVVANSQFTADAFRRGSGARIDVVYNLLGSEFSEVDPRQAEAFRSELGLGDSLLVGIVGQLTPWKGQDLAIRAFADALTGGGDMKLVLVGSAKFATVGSRFENDSYEARLRETVRGLDVQDRVIFAGQRLDVSGPMQAFAITLLPSHAEPFGRAAIEAMACGSAMIATSVGGTAEFIEDGENGLLRDPHDQEAWRAAIRLLADDSELRARLAARGQADVVRRFAADSVETQMVPIYRALLRR